ncbi:MAG TPA: inositol monophosphatase [Flavobacteriales bacterium]|nr:inositol monophosphatase [Flavobacteriales bacterium]
MNLEILTEKTCDLSREVGKFLRGEAGKVKVEDVESKGLHDFVTYVDKNAEQLLVEGLGKLLPEAGFITEEDTSSKKGERYTWVVDPLDGTTNFIHSVPCYSISIALMDGDDVVLGVIYEINLDECFYAWKGGGAHMNREKIQVSKASKLEDSLIITGFPNRDYSRLDAYLALFKYFMEETHGLRRFGSAAVDLAYVACGRGEGFYEYGLSAWDVAAGVIIVKEAGGEVTDFKGGEDFIFGGEIVAGNKNVFANFLAAISKYLT